MIVNAFMASNGYAHLYHLSHPGTFCEVRWDIGTSLAGGLVASVASCGKRSNGKGHLRRQHVTYATFHIALEQHRHIHQWLSLAAFCISWVLHGMLQVMAHAVQRVCRFEPAYGD